VLQRLDGGFEAAILDEQQPAQLTHLHRATRHKEQALDGGAQL
jgi:hypothetical protein